MAIANMFNKVKEASTTVIAVNALKKSLDEKMKEKMHIYSFLGMEVYELYTSGKLENPGLELHFEKIKALEQEISALELEKQNLESQSSGNNVCSCGYQLDSQSRFCPKCGKSVSSEFITCTCGAQVKADVKFCPACGNNMQIIQTIAAQGTLGTIQPQIAMKECICGAKVPEEQGMCMECGRKL